MSSRTSPLCKNTATTETNNILLILLFMLSVVGALVSLQNIGGIANITDAYTTNLPMWLIYVLSMIGIIISLLWFIFNMIRPNCEKK
ncbi:MAG: hypothetical protein WC934_02035 [Acidithiobacillus sp.]|jgi:TRAP-type C4-dicarboxylate transport system permease small subunit|uniref:hypothetical protein n=1 Tax=Acidithiobacillus sp. TaxID=1872118 RepID=UPI00355D7F95